MAEVCTFFPVVRTRGNLTFYMMERKNYVRKKSSLSARKVKTSPRFARTRHYAGLMAVASHIGSQLYKALPERWRQSWMYRSFTGEAMTLLKTGKTKEEVVNQLWDVYVAPVHKALDNRSTIPVVIPSAPKRAYHKKDTAYWNRKSLKARKRKARSEKLCYYAGLMASASTIASRVYQSIPAHRRKYPLYKFLTGCVMQLLKEEWEGEDIKAVLIKQMAGEQDKNNIRQIENQKSLFRIPFTLFAA